MNTSDQFHFTEERLEQIKAGIPEAENIGALSFEQSAIMRLLIADLMLARVKLQAAYQANAEMVSEIKPVRWWHAG